MLFNCGCVPGGLGLQGMDNTHISIRFHQPHAWHVAGLKNMLDELTKTKMETMFLLQYLSVTTRQTASSVRNLALIL